MTGKYSLSSFCHQCGTRYPWTESRLRALRELAEEMEGLTEEERTRLSGSIDDLIVDTPRTEVAVTRMKKTLAMAGAGAVEAVKRVLLEVATEAVKRQVA